MATSLYKKLIATGVTTAAAASAAFLIIPFEGSVTNPDGRHRVYLDAVGIPTACYGQTGKDHRGNPIKIGMTYSEDECLLMLNNTVREFERQVNNLVRVPYASPYQQASLISFAYNVGIGAFADSTLLRRLNAMDYNYACDELSRWVYARKQKLNGLVRRRAEERLWCLGQVEESIKMQIAPTDMTATLITETTPVEKDINLENTSDAIKEEAVIEFIQTPQYQCKWNNSLMRKLFCKGT